jgi:diacylglycerol kinase family enzyme
MLAEQGSTLIPKVGKPVVKFNNIGIRSVLVLLNGRAGWRQSLNYFNATLQYQLDREGVVYKVRYSPPDDLTAVLKSEWPEQYESVAIVGGDGTLNAYVNHAYTPELYKWWGDKPIVLIPTGMNNSVAQSLGISTPEATVSALRYGKIKRVPLWEATLGGMPVALIAGNLSVGFYADMVYDAHLLRLKIHESVALPMIKRRALFSSLYNTLYRFRTIGCDVKLFATDEPDAEPTQVIKGPLRTVVASQLPVQHSSYSLTPTANIDDGLLHVTVATKEASRLRMLHLVHREAPARGLLLEDGVLAGTARRLELDFYDGAPPDDPEIEEARRLRPWDPSLIRTPTRLGLFDGEVYPISSAEKLILRPSTLLAPVVVP